MKYALQQDCKHILTHTCVAHVGNEGERVDIRTLKWSDMDAALTLFTLEDQKPFLICFDPP